MKNISANSKQYFVKKDSNKDSFKRSKNKNDD